MFEKLGKKIYDAVLRCGSTLKSKPRSRFRVATSLCPRTILVQFTVCGIGIAQGAPISKQLWPIFDKNLAFIFFGKFSYAAIHKIRTKEIKYLVTFATIKRSFNLFHLM